MKEYVVGFDVGGTRLKSGAVTQHMPKHSVCTAQMSTTHDVIRMIRSKDMLPVADVKRSTPRPPAPPPPVKMQNITQNITEDTCRSF